MDILLVSAAIFGAFVSFRWAAKSSRKIRDREERKFIDHRIEPPGFLATNTLI